MPPSPTGAALVALAEVEPVLAPLDVLSAVGVDEATAFDDDPPVGAPVVEAWDVAAGELAPAPASPEPFEGVSPLEHAAASANGKRAPSLIPLDSVIVDKLLRGDRRSRGVSTARRGMRPGGAV
jgi:hypothetical protein